MAVTARGGDLVFETFGQGRKTEAHLAGQVADRGRAVGLGQTHIGKQQGDAWPLIGLGRPPVHLPGLTPIGRDPGQKTMQPVLVQVGLDARQITALTAPGRRLTVNRRHGDGAVILRRHGCDIAVIGGFGTGQGDRDTHSRARRLAFGDGIGAVHQQPTDQATQTAG